MEDLSLHILDIVENSTAAGATLIEIKLLQDTIKDLLQISVKDNGAGMEEEIVDKVLDPFTTSRTTRRVGMGIPLLAQSAREADGNLVMKSKIGEGTELEATFKNSHIDRRPVGDIGSTMVTLILGNPDINFQYESDFDGVKTEFDTRDIKAELDGVSITEPAVLQLIRDLF